MNTRFLSAAGLGYPDYEVGTDGTVRSVGRWSKPVTLTPWTHPRSGRPTVTLIRDCRRRSFALARLVLSVYRGERDKGWVPYHRNGDVTDCRPANLRWRRKPGPGREQALECIRGLMRKYRITPAELE